MGNCSGLFGDCNGQQPVRKVDATSVQEALRRNEIARDDGNAVAYGVDGVNMIGK